MKPAALPLASLAVLTPDGRGSVAVVRIWGPEALSVADAAFRPARGRPLAETPVDTPRLGRLGTGRGDEVVAIVHPGEPPEVEVHCHGGPQPLALVVSALQAAGAEHRQPSAWVRASARSRVQAEAVVDLARTSTLRCAAILLEQAAGALEAEVARAASMIEVDPAKALGGVDALLGRWRIGSRLVDGFTVALVGRPNVGKSRLLNALAGYERAIVDPTAGTTRDVLTIRTAVDGWPVEVADTAGVREADDPLERQGVALARARHERSDLTLLVLDVSTPLTPEDDALVGENPESLVVANKSDLPAAWQPRATARPAVPVSAATGEGLERLTAEFSRRLVAFPPEEGVGVPFRAAHARSLLGARDALLAGDKATALEQLRSLLNR